MGRLGVNLKDVEADGFPVYPEEVYQVQIIDYTPMTSTNGKNYLHWKGKIVQHATLTGRPVVYDTYETAPFQLKRLAQACGAETPDGDVDDDLIKGKVIAMESKHETHHWQTGDLLKKPRMNMEVVI